MIPPYFSWRILGGEVGKSYERTAAIWSRKMQPIVEWGRRKTDHLWELAGGYERSVRFSDHKYAIKGETANICQGMRKPNAAH
ncbi:hypothetical protein CF204P1_29530 [Citrobacter freundii]|nr:hypothetical protein CF204P1_29530 [Citrobacter freundii]